MRAILQRGRVSAPAITLLVVLLAGGPVSATAARGRGGIEPARPHLTFPALDPPDHLERFGSEHGLSHNGVHAILQDRRGFMWFGTQDGLNRWDGREFVVYRRAADDPTSLRSNFVRALHEDDDGNLWVGTAAGLHRIGPDRNGFEWIPLPRAERSVPSPGTDPAPYVNDLIEGPDGQLWVATTRGVVVVDPVSLDGRWLTVDADDPTALEAPRVRRLRVGPEGRIWALTRAADGASTLHYWLPDRGWHRYPLASSRSEFWLTDDGEVHFGGASARPVDSVGRGELAPGLPVKASALLEDGAGRLWIGTMEGLFLLEPDASAPRRITDTPQGEIRLRDEVVTIAEDRAGGVWIGTYGGVLHHDPAHKPFSHVDLTEAGFANGAVSSILDDGAEGLWIGSFGSGLGRLDLRSGELTRYRNVPGDPASLWHNWVWALDRGPDGRLWVATADGVCSVEDGDRFRRHPVPGRLEVARDLVVADDGVVWVASRFGLHRYDPAIGASRLALAWSGPDGHPSIVTRAADGGIWAGSAFPHGAVVRLDPATGETARYPGVAEEGIWDIRPTRDGRLWLATGAGLRRLDPRSGRVERIDPGGPGSVYYSIAPDARGRLWLGTNQGLVRHDPAAVAGEHFRRYDLADGVGSVEFNRGAALADGHGRLFFGGMQGLTAFDPLQIRDNPHVPPVAVTDVQILGEGGERHLSPFGLERLILGPDDYTVAFEFAALDFAEPSKNRYAYRLEGFDPEWIDAGTRPFARYTSIPPGEYRLRVRGSNNDGVWNRAGLTLPVVVKPPFWRTSWFAALVLVAIAGALTLAHRIRVARILELERVRTRIADDLHDELGSDLSGIALTSAMLRREEHLRERDRRRIAQVQETALEVMEGLRDIVWYIDPEHDSYEALEVRMREVADKLLADVEHEFHSTTPAGGAAVDMRVRPDLFLVYKELLNNVARHAGAERVEIRFGVERGELTLEIADDGVGFDPESVATGTGLRSVRRRAEQLGAELTIDSSPGAGTRVVLRGEL